MEDRPTAPGRSHSLIVYPSFYMLICSCGGIVGYAETDFFSVPICTFCPDGKGEVANSLAIDHIEIN
jgi:hypothetical protein